MFRIGHTLARFPQHELSIRRLYRQDPAFRGICDDYEDAVSAAELWESRGDARAADYHRLAQEVLVEIGAFLVPFKE